MHLIRSPGAIIAVVKIPENPPANPNWKAFNSELPVAPRIKVLPKSLPKKLRAKIGATPTNGAPMPAKKKSSLKKPKSISWELSRLERSLIGSEGAVDVLIFSCHSSVVVIQSFVYFSFSQCIKKSKKWSKNDLKWPKRSINQKESCCSICGYFFDKCTFWLLNTRAIFRDSRFFSALQTPLKPTAVIFQVLPFASMNFHWVGTLEVKANSPAKLFVSLQKPKLNSKLFKNESSENHPQNVSQWFTIVGHA